MIHITQRDRCRICDSVRFERILSLPSMPFTDEFVPADRLGKEFLADIEVFICCDCLTAQTLHDVEVGDYYEDYQYSVGGSDSAGRFMRQLANTLLDNYFPGTEQLHVLEIGSGDGEQLKAFQDAGCQVLGIEPSSKLCEVAASKGIPSLQMLFTPESSKAVPDGFASVDLILLSYTFDHLPDPRACLATAKSMLHPEHGILVVEVHDLEKIVERQEYCLFEHEHSIYLTQASARRLCEREGLVVIAYGVLPESERRANSLIFVATPDGSKFAEAAALPSTPTVFDDPAHYRRLGEEIRRGIANLESFVDRMTENGATLAGYGAGGRGVMTLAAMANASKLSYLVDRNPKRPGWLAPKSGLPVVTPDALVSSPVDRVLVFSFGYLDEIRNTLGEMGYSPDQLHSLVDVLREGR